MSVYLIHFAKKFKHCQHYIGYTEKPVEERFATHMAGKRSRLLKAVKNAEISFSVVRVWEGADGNFERKLKNRKKAKSLCPICRAKLKQTERRRNKRMIIAVDFDGTLCEHAFPEIGKPNEDLITELIVARAEGAKLILWTCREHIYLKQAIEWCLMHGLEFDAHNENVPEYRNLDYAYRKVCADIYIDDRSRPETWRREEEA